MEIKQKLHKFYMQRNIPNIILYGPCNSGKKTILFEFLNILYNNDKQKIKQNIMVCNCSHGKGIKFVREDLKTFAKSNMLYGEHDIHFKSVVLLNAHSLTNDAQSALRRCIEIFNHNTRFFVVLEDKNKLLKPILSRFCDIYVPYREQSFISENINIEIPCLDPWFKQLYENTEKNINTYVANNKSKIIVTKTNEIYEAGLSALDIINYLKTQDYIKQEEKARIIFQFEQIKSNFKFEKLTIFYVLQSIFLYQ